MDTTEQVIREVQRRWDEAQSADVIDLAQRRQEKARKDWMRKHTRPMPPPTRPAA